MGYWSWKARSIVNANSSLAPAAKLQGVRLSETGDRDTSDGAPRVTEKTGRRKGGAVTIHEVARHASVSPMTVSRVINGESNVRDTTRETRHGSGPRAQLPAESGRPRAGRRARHAHRAHLFESQRLLSIGDAGRCTRRFASHRVATGARPLGQSQARAGKGRRAETRRRHHRRDPAAAAVRIESHRRGLRRRGRARGGAGHRQGARRRVLRAHRRLPRGARNDRST